MEHMERMESNSEKDHEYRTGRSRRCGGDSDFGGVDSNDVQRSVKITTSAMLTNTVIWAGCLVCNFLITGPVRNLFITIPNRLFQLCHGYLRKCY